MAVNRPLPTQIFFNRKNVAVTGLFQTQQTAPYSRYHFRLAADDPAMTSGCGQIGNCKGAAIGTDDVINPWTQLTVHTETHKPKTQVL